MILLHRHLEERAYLSANNIEIKETKEAVNNQTYRRLKTKKLKVLINMSQRSFN